MSDLEAKIAAWRAELSVALPNQAETVRELESYLRDHLEHLQRQGVPAEEALARTIRRLGTSRALAREFDRLRSPWWPQARVPQVVLLLLLGALAAVAALAGERYAAGKATLLLAAHLVTVSTGYLTVLAMGLIAAWSLMNSRRNRAEKIDRGERELEALGTRLVLLSCGCVPVGVGLGSVWASDNLGRAWAWTPIETSAGLVLVSLALLLVGHRVAPLGRRGREVLMVLAALVTVSAWLAPKTGGPMNPIVWCCAAFGLGEAAVLGWAARSRQSLATD
jgi:cytochrome c assembly protein